jgi:pimeloyl-ACP methyl ester carboxylesterase
LTGEPVLLLHGWPDSPVSWSAIAETLNDQGYRTIAPYLRGSFPTEFLAAETPRDASAAAMAQDAIDLADRLGTESFYVVGHDWGARVAYTLATLFPARIRAITTLALAYQPYGAFHLSTFEQSRHFWYQFFQCTPAGAEAVRRDPVGFARIQWETWSPEGWFTEEAFQAASKHFASRDWAEITLNAYRSRYLPGETADGAYAELQARLKERGTIDVPTVMIQGAADTCDLAVNSEGQDRFFSEGYRRVLLEGIGHFPHREAPALVSEHVLAMLRR